MPSPAVFLDRDDTLVVDSSFIDHPSKIVLAPGAIEAVRRLHRAGFKVIVASNQSGVARGLFDEDQLARIHDRLRDLLAAGDEYLDGIYYCPFLDGPEAKIERYRKASDLRKPAPGMLLQAAADLDVDLRASWMVGDSVRDVQAGVAAGCRSILISRNGSAIENADAPPCDRAASLLEAVAFIEREATADVPTQASAPVASPPALSPRRRSTGSREGNDDVPALLTEIRDLLDRRQREDIQDDFSLVRLLATLLQMLAVFVAAWGVFAMLNEDVTPALMRFALAGFLQLLLISVRLTQRPR